MSLLGVSGISRLSSDVADSGKKNPLNLILIRGGDSDASALKDILTFKPIKEDDALQVDSEGDTTLHAALFAYKLAGYGIVPTVMPILAKMASRAAPHVAIAAAGNPDGDATLTLSRLLAANMLSRSVDRFMKSVMDRRIRINRTISFYNAQLAIDSGVTFDAPNNLGVTPAMVVATIRSKHILCISGAILLLFLEVVRQGEESPLLVSIANMRDANGFSAYDYMTRSALILNKNAPRAAFFRACNEKNFSLAFQIAKSGAAGFLPNMIGDREEDDS